MQTSLKLPLLTLVVAGACASSRVPEGGDVSSVALQTIRDAEAAGAARHEKAAPLLEEARSQAEYAARLPGDPAHAQRLYARAHVDAELALVLARQRPVVKPATPAAALTLAPETP